MAACPRPSGGGGGGPEWWCGGRSGGGPWTCSFTTVLLSLCELFQCFVDFL